MCRSLQLHSSGSWCSCKNCWHFCLLGSGKLETGCGLRTPGLTLRRYARKSKIRPHGDNGSSSSNATNDGCKPPARSPRIPDPRSLPLNIQSLSEKRTPLPLPRPHPPLPSLLPPHRGGHVFHSFSWLPGHFLLDLYELAPGTLVLGLLGHNNNINSKSACMSEL